MSFLTTTAAIDDAFTSAFSAALGGLASLMAIGWVIGLIILICTVALITWIVKKVWYAGSDRKYRKQQKQWEKAQAKAYKQDKEYQEFQEWKKQKKDPSKGFENNPDWYWDEAAQLWRYKGKGQQKVK